MRRWWRLALAAVGSIGVAAALACSGVIVADMNTVPAGTWGGDHAQMVVGASVSTVQLDCAHGSFDSPLRVGRNGRFDVQGVFVREHGGPVRPGEVEDRHTARFVGLVNGGILRLSIVVQDLNLDLGEFVLVLGGTSRLTRCL